ncbi:MAG: DNA polymerase IV [Geoalkalibacter sp.]|uniref:DNA polymerase IV n=1 Tax=Geoalkalibacter sp. TaxID=3041440 RepID=UPI003D0BD95D
MKNALNRCILHLDMDAFYASVEQYDQPHLRGRPVVVGGHRQRGVVCAASYEARAFGVHSAMPMARAVQLCPQAVVLPVRMQRYREVSREIFSIFAEFTDQIEPLSVDEAFLDVTGSRALFGSGVEIAQEIRRRVRVETGLAVSAGIATNKFLAKMASEAAKPDGLKEITPGEVDDFLLSLPVSALWGVGRTAEEKLAAYGISTVAGLRTLSLEALRKHFGKNGARLYELCRGIDSRPVRSDEESKSIGHEDTFEFDLLDPEEIRRALLSLSERVASRLRRKKLQGSRVTLKVKYADFTTITKSKTLNIGISNGSVIFQQATELMKKTDSSRPIRLLGITLSTLDPLGSGQSDLFEDKNRKRLYLLDQAVDKLQRKYGENGVRKGSLLKDDSTL